MKPQFSTDNVLLDVYVKANSGTSFFSLLTKDVPVLFAFEMFFKSKMKLIPKDYSAEEYLNKWEIHSVQFEVETKFNVK